MDSIQMEASLVINLISLALDRGLPAPVLADEIKSLVLSDIPDIEKMNALKRYHSSLHEILYAPPGK